MLKYSEAIYQGKIDQLTEYISMLNGHVEKLTAYKAVSYTHLTLPTKLEV